jgi:hypothetical protein
MATPEGRVKDKVRRLFSKYGAQIYSFMPVQTGLGASTLDFLCCVNGLAFYVETKADKTKKPTKRQDLIADQMREAGAMVFIVYDDDSLNELKHWLNTVAEPLP